MREVGQVIALDNGVATVRFERSSACAKCGKCMMSESQQEMLLKVNNTLKANVGDWVAVELANVSLYRASFVAYGVPTILLILGMIGGYLLNEQLHWLSQSELMACIGGVLLMAIGFLAIRWKEPKRKASGRYNPSMVEYSRPQQPQIEDASEKEDTPK